MYNIVDNKIFLSRGDSATLGIDITDDEGDAYTPTSDEVVLFTLKRTTGQCKTILTKEFTEEDDALIITFEQSDTAGLAFGVYKYDVALIGEDGVYTIIEPTDFEIMEVVHNEITRND